MLDGGWIKGLSGQPSMPLKNRGNIGIMESFSVCKVTVHGRFMLLQQREGALLTVNLRSASSQA